MNFYRLAGIIVLSIWLGWISWLQLQHPPAPGNTCILGGERL